MSAVRRHWPFVLAPTVIALVVAAAVGISYQPIYTAQATMNVGRLNVSANAIPGYAVAIQNLAVSYGRLITADGVVTPVAAKLHLRAEPGPWGSERVAGPRGATHRRHRDRAERRRTPSISPTPRAQAFPPMWQTSTSVTLKRSTCKRNTSRRLPNSISSKRSSRAFRANQTVLRSSASASRCRTRCSRSSFRYRSSRTPTCNHRRAVDQRRSSRS